MRLHALPFAILGLALSACGGGDSTGPRTLTSVVITTSSGSSVLVGHSLQWVATPKDQNGVAMTATIGWSSATTSVATVTSTGLVNGVGVGTAQVTATATVGATTVQTQRQVTVTGPPVLTTVTINAPATTIVAGATVQLSAVPKDQNGTPVTATVGWTTSDNTKATVDNSGLVTTIAQGTVTITATATAGSATVHTDELLTIVSGAGSVLTTLNVTPPSATLSSGQTVQLLAAPLDQNGALMAATVTWTTSNGSLATVSTSGLVSAVADGGPTITAHATAGAVTLTHDVVVTIQTFSLTADVSATAGLLFSPSSVDIAVGGTVTWNFAFTHNVTFSTVGSPANIPDTGVGNSVGRVFNTAGTFSYHCTIHAGMTGSVVVH